MKKHFKGFTLIECLVALAILGVGSLIMAQIYANVARININNHNINTSLSAQMALVEQQTKTDAIAMYYGGGTTSAPDPNASDSNTDKFPPHKQTTSTGTYRPYISATSSYSNIIYSYPVDIYVLLSRDANGNSSADADFNKESVNWNSSGGKESDYNLRYKYILGHSN